MSRRCPSAPIWHCFTYCGQLLSGALLSSRGAVFPALFSLGLSAVQMRRSSQAMRDGVWSSAELVARWRDWVAVQGWWQPRSYEGYQPLAVDITAFWRPRPQDWLGKFFYRLAHRAVRGIGFAVVVQVGHSGEQRLPLLKPLICADQDTISESQFKASVLKTAGQNLGAHEVVVHDAGASIADIQTAKVPRCVVRLDRNCTAQSVAAELRRQGAARRIWRPRASVGPVVQSPPATSYAAGCDDAV